MALRVHLERILREAVDYQRHPDRRREDVKKPASAESTACRVRLFLTTATALALVVSVALLGASGAAADQGWFMLMSGTISCTGPGGPFTATASLDIFVRGDYPSEVFSGDDPTPPNPPFQPDIVRYLDRVDITNDCIEPFVLQYPLTDGTLVQGIVLPGVDRTLDHKELADLGIRFKLSELLNWGGMGFPAPPPPYDFVIEP